jgi:hypothetical protein
MRSDILREPSKAAHCIKQTGSGVESPAPTTSMQVGVKSKGAVSGASGAPEGGGAQAGANGSRRGRFEETWRVEAGRGA